MLATAAAAKDMSSRHAGVVSVGVFVPEFYARRFITDFARENPEVTFEINGRDDGRGALCNDPYDVVFLSRTEGYSGFTCVDFALDGLGVVVSPGHRLAGRESVALSELEGERFGVLSDSDREVELLVNSFCVTNPSASVRIRCNSMRMLRHTVVEDLCVGIVREGYREEFCSAGASFVRLEDARGRSTGYGSRSVATPSCPMRPEPSRGTCRPGFRSLRTSHKPSTAARVSRRYNIPAG